MSEEEPKKKSARGFAAMSPEKRREMGSRGGKAAHERGVANVFTSDTASAAGRIPHERGTAYKWTSDEARRAGRAGGRARRKSASEKPEPGTGVPDTDGTSESSS